LLTLQGNVTDLTQAEGPVESNEGLRRVKSVFQLGLMKVRFSLLAEKLDLDRPMSEASSTLRRSRLIHAGGRSCLLAPMHLGWRSRRLDGREGLQDAIGMLGARRHNPGVAGLQPHNLALDFQLGSP
jgi:hypothetical protein